MTVPQNADKVAVALGDCAYVENVRVEYRDINNERYN